MKGQTQQVFIYIMVILIVGAILLFGYKSIHNILEKSKQVDLATFQTGLWDVLEKNNGYGDRYSKPVDAPGGYDALCFINSSKEGVNLEQLQTFNIVMYQETFANTGNNVFLINFNTAIVTPSSSGILKFEDLPGTYHGRCYCTCHGENHNPLSY